MRLLWALAVRGCTGYYPEFLGVTGQRQIVRVLFDQPVTRLVQRHIFLCELIDRLCYRGDQIREAFHLPNRGVDDGIEGAVHQRGHELRKIQLVAERTGPPADRFGGRFAARLSVAAVRQRVEWLIGPLLGLHDLAPEGVASERSHQASDVVGSSEHARRVR
jgi:hypothetical protein